MFIIKYGENPASDFAVNDIKKVWYRTSLLGSTLYAVNQKGDTIAHMMYDPWGNPLTETYTDTNFSGIDNLNNYTGYTWDETLDLYFAQNRFYDAQNHRFTQEDIIKDGANWYGYCENNPLVYVDWYGLDNGRTRYTKTGAKLRVDGIGKKQSYYSLDPNTTVWRTYHDNGEWIGVSVLGTGQTGQIKASMLKLEKSQGSAPTQTGRTASTRSSASTSTKTTKPADSAQIAAGTKKAPQNTPSASTIIYPTPKQPSVNVGTGIGAAVGVMAAAGKEASGFATTNQNIALADGPLPVGDAVLYAGTAAIFAGSLAEGIGDIRQQRSYMQKVQCEGTDNDAENVAEDNNVDGKTKEKNKDSDDSTETDYYVTKDGVILKKGIPEEYVENPHRNGNYGVIDETTGKYVEKLRIDPPTPKGQNGPDYSHYHINNGKTHFSPRPGGKNPLGF